MSYQIEQVRTYLEQATRDQEFNRRNRNLTASLAAMIQLKQHGNELIEILGSGKERTNLQALETWVAKEMKKIKDKQIEALDYLYARIQEELGPVDY